VRNRRKSLRALEETVAKLNLRISQYLLGKLRPTYSPQDSSMLAAATTAALFGEPPDDPRVAAYRQIIRKTSRE